MLLWHIIRHQYDGNRGRGREVDGDVDEELNLKGKVMATSWLLYGHPIAPPSHAESGGRAPSKNDDGIEQQ